MRNSVQSKFSLKLSCFTAFTVTVVTSKNLIVKNVFCQLQKFQISISCFTLEKKHNNIEAKKHKIILKTYQINLKLMVPYKIIFRKKNFVVKVLASKNLKLKEKQNCLWTKSKPQCNIPGKSCESSLNVEPKTTPQENT